MLSCSIEQSEQPEGNLVAKAYLYIIGSHIAVGEITNLREALSLASDFEKICVIDQQVTLGRILQLVALTKHGCEKCLSYGADVHGTREGLHQVGIVEQYLLRFP